MKWVTASDIKNWADKKQKHCAETLPELIRRLIFATADSIALIDFPAGDSTATGGWDGYLEVPEDLKSPFVPAGKSDWEIGAQKSSGKKAQEDYEKRQPIPEGSQRLKQLTSA
jgi:hypothetical protein